MKDIIGRPGTKLGLCLRIGQCLSAFLTVATIMYPSMYKHSPYYNVADSYFTQFMGVQFISSFFLACIDVFAVTMKKDLRASPNLFTSILFVDGVLSTLLFGATCSRAAVEFYYIFDLKSCTLEDSTCRSSLVYVGVAFLCCFLSSLSAYIEFFSWPSIIFHDDD
ncbi:CASP-like protein 5B2 [Bienertia sinuspersici]